MSKLQIKYDEQDYRSLNAEKEVIGCFINQPALVNEYKVVKEDFVNLPIRAIWTAVERLAKDGNQFIDSDMIEDCLEKYYPSDYRTYQRSQGINFLGQAVTKCHPMNFEANYNELKKWTMLRSFMNQGIDIRDIYDPDDWDDEDGRKKNEAFKDMTLDELYDRVISRLDKIQIANHSSFEFDTIDNIPHANDPIEWLIDGVIKKHTFNEIVAASKAGKSQLGYQLAYEVHNGLDFLRLFKTCKGKVMYIDFENYPSEIKQRVDKMKAYKGKLEDVSQMCVTKLKQGDLDRIIKKCIEMKKKDDSYELVVFDNFYSLLGAVNANDMSETGELLDSIKWPLIEAGLTGILVNHTAKGTGAESEKLTDDKITQTYILNSAYGSMTHGAKVDTLIFIQIKADGRRIHIAGRSAGIKPTRISCHYGPETGYTFVPIWGENEGVEEIINRMTQEQIDVCKDYLDGEKKRLTSFDTWTEKTLGKKFNKDQLRSCRFEVFKDNGNYYIRVRHIFGQKSTDPYPKE